MPPVADGFDERSDRGIPLAERRVVAVAGARIELDLTGVDSALLSGIDDAWSDAVVPDALVAAVTLLAKDHLSDGIDGLARAVVREARTALRASDVCAMEATLLIERRRAVVVLSDAAHDVLPAGSAIADGFVSLGSSVLSMDPQGAIDCYRGPVRVSDDAGGTASFAPPSRFGGRTLLPRGVRVGALVLAERSARAEIVRLDLAESLAAVAQRSTVFGGSRMPLRSLARIVAAVGGVVLVRYADPAELAHALIEIDVPADPVSHTRHPERSPRDEGETLRDGERLFRAGPVDFVDTPEGDVVLLRRLGTEDELTVLSVEEAEIWRAANGGTEAEVFGRADPRSDEAAWDSALRRLERRGLISHEPWWRIAEGVVWSEQDDTTVALNLGVEGSAPTALGGSAHPVWHIIARDVAVSRSRVLAESASLYGVEPDVIADDVDELLDTLRRSNLIERL